MEQVMWRRGPSVHGVAETWVVDEAPFTIEVIVDLEEKAYFFSCPSFGIEQARVFNSDGKFDASPYGLEDVLLSVQYHLLKLAQEVCGTLEDAFIERGTDLLAVKIDTKVAQRGITAAPEQEESDTPPPPKKKTRLARAKKVGSGKGIKRKQGKLDVSASQPSDFAL
jgi:hypothetical protein